MNAVRNANFDALKRPRVFGTILIVIVLAIVWYLFWWSHESSKQSSINAQVTTAQAQITQLKGELSTVIIESHLARKYHQSLLRFEAAVPDQPEIGTLNQQIGALAKSDGLTIATIDADNPVPAATGSTLSTIPVTLTASGSDEDINNFLKGLYGLSRLITVQEFQPSPQGGGATPNVLKTQDPAKYTISLTATAYYAGGVTPST